MAPYKYAPLNEDTEIRLLTLLPDWFEAPIHISLEITVLSDSEVPEFEALSYVWGDASDLLDTFLETSPSKPPELRETDDIDSIEWRTLRITKNLFEALKHLRLEDRPRVLWIDAICVDQQNLEERGHQVLRMPNIYTSAKGVIVWLGPESDDTAIAMNDIQDLGSRITVDWDLGTMAPASESDFDPHSEKSYSAVEPSPQVWRSIHNLLGRAWFERLWTIQEVCLAGKNTHVVCGSVKISYKHFGNGICYLLNWKDVDNSNVKRLWDMVEHLLVLSNKTYFSYLDWVLAHTRQSQCSDQRDKVYAILSLVPEKERLEIRPDYTLSVPEVFQSVVLQQARCRSRLNVLRFCSMNSRIMDLPTWVPDWSVGFSVESLRRVRADAAAKAYLCFESEGTLVATGLYITVVDNIKKDFTDRIPRTRYASTQGIRELISAVVGGETNDRRIDKLHSLCRTLCTAEFRGMSTPANPDFPLLEESLKYIMDCDNWLRQNSTKPPKPHPMYMRYVNRFSCSRVLVTSTDGRLGLAPRATKPGDKICIILGCPSPLVLRSDDNGFSHKVVGEYYLDGIMTGEALLGELPKEWTMLQKYYPEYHAAHWLFLDSNTGQTHVDNPRLGPLPDGWRFKSHEEEDAWNWFVNDGTDEDTRFDPSQNLASETVMC